MFRQWFGSLVGKTSTPARKAPRRKHRANLALENLETRCLLSNFLVSNLGDSGTGSLRQAIINANNHANTAGTVDTVTFKAGLAGKITLTSGDIAITDGVSIIGNGHIKVDGNGLATNQNATKSRIFDVNISTSSGNVAILNLTLQNGYAHDGYDGGGILDRNAAKLTVQGVRIQNCFAESTGEESEGNGGGIAADSETGKLVIINSVITGNTASAGEGGDDYGRGGGIHSVAASTVIQNSVISNNTSGSEGGGIDIQGGTFSITNSTISGNSVGMDEQGGGIGIRDASGTIQGSTISGNTTGGEGGGIAFQAGNLTMINCTVANNHAGYGGGLYLATYSEGTNTQKVSIQSCTIAGNTATQGAGGIVNESGTTTLKNTIVAQNKLQREGGTTIADLFNSSSQEEEGGATITATYSLIQAPGTALSAGSNHNILGQDPHLGALAFNGGPTQTMALLPGSHAINAGDPNFRPPPSTDQRGPGFVRVFGGRIDIGAFELQPPPSTAGHRGQYP
jgi:hypothetical protein